MRETTLLRKILLTYKALNLSQTKMVVAVLLMIVTSVLEMSGLSVLYPLVLSMGAGGSADPDLQIIPFLRDLSAREQMIYLFSAVAFLYVSKNIALYFTYQHNINFAVYFYRHLIKGLYSAHLQKPLLDFQRESSGSLANIICVETERMIHGTVRPIMVVFSELAILLGITFLVLFINPILMTAVILACTGAGALYYILLRAKTLQWGVRQSLAASSLQELVHNTARGISEIKVFGRERFLTERLEQFAAEKTRMFHHLEMHQQGPRYIAETVFILTVVVFFSILLRLGNDPAILLAQFSVVAAASFRLLPSINRIVHSYSNFSFHVAPSTALLDTILQSHILDGAHAVEAKDERGTTPVVNAIQAENISFTYPLSHRPIIKSTTLKFTAGERIGLVGESGSGKSTFIKILAGLYSPNVGAVKVDGRNIGLELKMWQSLIGYVPQESFVFPGTISENIAFGQDASADLEKIWKALERVGLKEFVRALPDGVASRVGEKGISLSGGQKQLLCLARALYRNPKVLLLDEPTASLDSANEQIVLDIIERLPRETIIIMASHKHKNFRSFDSIYSYNFENMTFEETEKSVFASTAMLDA